MSVYPEHDSRGSPIPFHFRVEIRNVGEIDLLLLLGGMVANGRKQYPEAVKILLTDPQGEGLTCEIRDGPFAIHGWGGPFIVPLLVGASFSLPIDLMHGNLCSTPHTIVRLALTPGWYVLRARYTTSAEKGNYFPMAGSPRPRFQQPDTIVWGGIILIPKWFGTATSDQLEFQVPGRSAAK
jgi:hypothetical protein